MVDAQPELDFGAFALVPANPSGVAYTVNTLAELDFGNPNPVVAPIQSLLQDGSLAEILSHENRDVVIRVEISGPDLAAVEDGELALMGEVNKGRNVLRWLPPNSFAHPVLYDVIWSRLDYAFDDMGELRCVRTFTITLNCSPFGRSEEETVVEATSTGSAPPAPASATVDDCTSLTGWALTSDPAAGGGFYTVTGPTLVSGAVRGSLSTTTTRAANFVLTLTRTGLAEAMASTPYLVVTTQGWASGSPGPVMPVITFKVNGVAKTALAQVGNDYYFDCSDITTLSSVEATGSFATEGRTSVVASFWVDNISRTNQPPFIGTGRQQFRQFTVGGSARTQGSIQLAHDTDALGDALVYTCNANDAGGAQPSLRQHRTTGGAITVDTTTASGARSPLNSGTPETFDIPAAAVANGTHSLMAIVKSATTGWKAIDCSVSTLVGGVELGTETHQQSVYLPTTGWTIVELGRVTLPPVALQPGSTAKVRIELSSAVAVDLDEALIFHAIDGALSWVKCGTGTPAAGGPSSRLWIDTASLDWTMPAKWLGVAADGSDNRHAIGYTEVPADGAHMLEPGVINLYTLTLGAVNVAASAWFFPRWQHNAGGV